MDGGGTIEKLLGCGAGFILPFSAGGLPHAVEIPVEGGLAQALDILALAEGGLCQGLEVVLDIGCKG